jgi:predicted ATP-grasp superfamily ATP-dependent carboligase
VKQPLAIVGASTRSASASAVRAGFQPIAADLFADADLRRIATTTRISPYPEGFLDWLRAVDPPAWMYMGALENHPKLIDQMAWIAPLWGNPGDVLARVRSPWELSKALTSAGLLFPETCATPDDLPPNGRWLAKTYRGASGSGVREWTGDQSSMEGICFQKRVGGTPCSAVFVAADGAVKLLGVTRQLIGEPWLGAHGFQFAGSIGPLPISEAVNDTILRIGSLLVEQFDLLGLFGVDFMFNGDDVWTLEVNPRYTASVEIVERFSGVCAIAEHAAACGEVRESERIGSSSTPVPASGKGILFARRDLVISDPFSEWSLAESARLPWPTLADVSPAGTLTESGRPILTFFADGEDVFDVEQQLRALASELESKIAAE